MDPMADLRIEAKLLQAALDATYAAMRQAVRCDWCGGLQRLDNDHPCPHCDPKGYALHARLTEEGETVQCAPCGVSLPRNTVDPEWPWACPECAERIRRERSQR